MITCVKRGLAILALVFLTVGMFGWMDEAIETRTPLEVRNIQPLAADVAFIGSSHMYCSVIPQLLMDEYGLAAVNDVTSSLTANATLDVLEGAVAAQAPAVAIIDLYGFSLPTYVNNVFTWDGMKERNDGYYVVSNRVLSGLSWTKPERYRLIYRRWEEDPRSLPYAFPLYVRHEELLKQVPKNTYAKGGRWFDARFGYSAFQNRRLEPGYALSDSFSEETLENVHMYEPYRQLVDRLLAYGQEKGVELVFALHPFFQDRAEKKATSELYDYLNQRGATLVTMEDMMEQSAFDADTDYADPGHLNNDGAMKITRFWGDYLSSRFALPDRSQDDDPKYAPWKERPYGYQADATADSLKQITDYEDYCLRLSDLSKDYIVMVFVCGADEFSEEYAYADILASSLNLDTDTAFSSETPYFALFSCGEALCEQSVTTDAPFLRYEQDDGYKAVCDEKGRVRVYLNNKRVDVGAGGGIGLVVYDSLKGTAADSVFFECFRDAPRAVR